MNIFDVIIIAVIAVCLFFALRNIKSAGACCGNCSSCKNNCSTKKLK